MYLTFAVNAGVPVAGTVNVAVPLYDGSCVLVTVTVPICAVEIAAGAVNNPVLSIAPSVVDTVAPCDGLLVPRITQLKSTVPPPATVVDDGVTVTPVIVDAEELAGTVNGAKYPTPPIVAGAR
jgi:hypothetical protein